MKMTWRKLGASALAAAFLITGCDGMKYRQERRMANFTVTAADFDAIAQATVALIDPTGSIGTIVIPLNLDPRAVTALKRLRPVTDQAPSTATEILPAGYFLIRTFSIGEVEAEPEAMVQGQLGPVTRTMTAANLPDCGKIYAVAFVLRGGEWFSPSYKIESCAESRHWVPIDSQRR